MRVIGREDRWTGVDHTSRIEVVRASQEEDDEISRILNDERVPGVSPRMLPIARALLGEGSAAELRKICAEPVDALIGLLEELPREHRADAALTLTEFPAHLEAIDALAALATPKGLGFLISWLQYTEIDEVGRRGPYAALERAGKAAHPSIIEAWATLTWTWRAALIGCCAKQGGIRDEVLLRSFAADLQQIHRDERLMYTWAAADYGAPELVPRIEGLLDLCLDEFDPACPMDFYAINEIAFEVLEAYLGRRLSPSRRMRVEAARAQLANDPKFGWIATAHPLSRRADSDPNGSPL